MLLGETLTQISKERIKKKIGVISDEKTQKEILNVYISNITGKRRSSIWYRMINIIFKLVKDGEYAV